jgi:uncharacterized membrane protein YtjA (UPF0391 family)
MVVDFPAPGRPAGLARQMHWTREEGRYGMSLLGWTLVFLVLAIIAAIFGFAVLAAAAATIAKILFAIFIVVFLITLISHLVRRV